MKDLISCAQTGFNSDLVPCIDKFINNKIICICVKEGHQ